MSTPPLETASPPPRNPALDVLQGFLICAACNAAHLILGIAAIFTMVGPFILLGGFPVVQLLYVIPLIRYFRRRNRRDVAKGVIIAASISALLSIACDINMFSGGFRIGG